MTNRRHFLRTVAGTVAGGYFFFFFFFFVIGRGLLAAGAQAPAAPIVRRQVSVGGRRVRVVDIHAHGYFVPPVVDIVRGTPFASKVAVKQEPLGPQRIRPLDYRGSTCRS